MIPLNRVAKNPSLLSYASFASNPASKIPMMIFKGAMSFAPNLANAENTLLNGKRNLRTLLIIPPPPFAPPPGKKSITAFIGAINVSPIPPRDLNIPPILEKMPPPAAPLAPLKDFRASELASIISVNHFG